MNKLSKVTLATAAAAFFTTATVPATYAAGAGAEPVKCLGVNACKGHGWILVPSAEECAGQGGTVL